MEKQMKNQLSGIVYAFFKLFLVALLLLQSTVILHAQTVIETPGAEIKYIGVVDNKLVFQINYRNDGPTPFSLEIKDNQGYQFYFGKFKEKSFQKLYAIDKAELGENELTFEFSAKGKVQKQVFEINTSSRLVEELNVTQL